MSESKKGSNKSNADQFPGSGTKNGSGFAQPPDDSAFDRWLSDKLTTLYGPVLREPIPDELIDVIEAHKRKN